MRVAKGLEKVAASGDPAAIDDFVKQNGAADQKAQEAREGSRHAGLRGVAVTRLVWLVLAAALLAGCGSYGTSTTSAGGRLTKVEWISAADDICSRSKEEASDLPAPQSPSALVTQLDSLIGIFQREVDDLKTLTPSRLGEGERPRPWSRPPTLQLTLAQELQEVARTGDTAAIQAFTTANQPKVQEAQRVAGAYGLKVCGSGRETGLS